MSLSIASQIGPQLPLLRRHARALTGSQVSGDAVVRAMLEALASGEPLLDQRLPTRLGLYRAFHLVWSSASGEPRPGVHGIALAGLPNCFDDRLAEVTPLSREAFLLNAMEGFSASDVSVIMGVDADRAAALIQQAFDEIALQTRTRVLIIEDEPLIAMDLQHIVEAMGHTVIGIARTHGEALKLCDRQTPGLILSDIQLADGSSGQEATIELLKRCDAPVIFITAFPERLLTGERAEPAFLISKPFNDSTVQAAISQSLFFNTASLVAA